MIEVNGVIAHSTVDEDRVVEAVERGMQGLDNPGFCLSCGAEMDGCEPDMRGGECEICGESQVYGAEELLLHFAA